MSSQPAALPLAFYSALLRVRPAQVGDIVKRLLWVHRMAVTSLTGHRFCLDPVSVFGLNLLRNGIYEAQMTKLVQLVLGPSDVFIDIGANEGYFSVIASSQLSNGAVHCIEPQSRLLGILRKNFELNGSRVILHETAISDQDGHLDLFLRPSTNTGASSMFRHWRLGSRVERVACTTLDSFFQKNSIAKARLIKIDCEGAEALVVEGAKGILTEHRVEFIAMEYHPSICGVSRCRDAHTCLMKAGYMLTTVSGQCVYHLPGLEEKLRPLGELRTHANWPR
jgi:FkbM family methyltransferase